MSIFMTVCEKHARDGFIIKKLEFKMIRKSLIVKIRIYKSHLVSKKTTHMGFCSIIFLTLQMGNDNF